MNTKRFNSNLFSLLIFLASVCSPFINARGTSYSLLELCVNSSIVQIRLISYLFVGAIFANFCLDLLATKVNSHVKFFSSILGFVFDLFICSMFNEFMVCKYDVGLILIGIYFFIKCIYYLRIINGKIIYTIKDIVEISLFISMAIILNLSFLKIRIGSNGGSISLAMLPLVLIALRKDFNKSFIACGIVYGLVNCLFDQYGIYSFIFDYLLAFGSMAIISLFRKLIVNNKKRLTFNQIFFLILSISIAVIFRLLAHTMSGIIFYGLSFLPSLIYQLNYVIPSYLAVLVISIILLKPLLIINRKFPSLNE